MTEPGDRTPFVHSTAVVDDGAAIGDGTRIWHFSHVMSGARIGQDCTLGQSVFVADGVTIGDGTKIQNNVSLYHGVELGALVFVGPSVVFTNVRTPRAHIPRNTPAHFDPTRVGRGATLGANATIVCGHDVGAWAFVGAGAVVTRTVRPHERVLGVPARHAGWACTCGALIAWTELAGRCSACERTWHRNERDPDADVTPDQELP